MGLLFLLLGPGVSVSSAAQTVKIGVLAFRPKPQTLAQWQPLASALKQEMPQYDFVVEALTYPEMNEAVAFHRLDFVFTNPGHFVQLKMGGKLSAPLATLSVRAEGKVVNSFGGVIIAGAGRADIATLKDIKGKTVAVPDVESLGGYQMQAYELSLAGVSLPKEAKLLVTGMPHDNVVKAVLEGRADVGFVRSGVVEGAQRDGKLDAGKIKVLNHQFHSGFPQLLSTRLYPEWPFAALRHTDEKLARYVAAALFTLDENAGVFKASGIQGFSVPADYTPVELVLRTLRFPPFDSAPDFTISDVLERYSSEVAVGAFFLVAIFILGFRLVLTKRSLEHEKALVAIQTRKLQESEANLRTVIETEPECVKQLSPEGRLISMNRAGLMMVEADSFEQVAGRMMVDLVVEEYREGFRNLGREIFAGNSGSLVFQIQGLKGGFYWLETHAVPLRNSSGEIVSLLGITRDITSRITFENERNAALSMVRKLEGILPICASCKKIRDERGNWHEVEYYVSNHSDAEFSHGICPDCVTSLYPDFAEDKRRKG